MTPIADMLIRMDLFSDLTRLELQEIADVAIVRTYRSKSNVFMEGESRHAVYFLNRGVIKVYKVDNQGNEAIMNFLKPGEMFPHAGFFENAPYPGTAEVILDAEIGIIPVKDFEHIVMNRPEIAMKVMRVMGRKIRDLQSKLRDLSSNDIHFRIAAQLLWLAREYGVQRESGILIDLRSTNTDLAKMAGTTRETVNRFLNRLKREDVLVDEPRVLIVRNLERLEAYIQ